MARGLSHLPTIAFVLLVVTFFSSKGKTVVGVMLCNSKAWPNMHRPQLKPPEDARLILFCYCCWQGSMRDGAT